MAPATQSLVTATASPGFDSSASWNRELSISAGAVCETSGTADPVVRAPLPFARCSPVSGASCSEAILTSIDELEAYLDVDTVLRRAVELARSRVGAERTAIFLDDAPARLMRGSWGTGAAGETTDEHELCFDSGDTDTVVRRAAEFEAGPWLLLEHAPHLAHGEGQTRVLGEGWLAVTPIRSEKRFLGVMFNDAAFSGQKLDPELQDQLSLFCRLLGDVIEARLRHPHLPRPTPAACAISDLVRQTARALRVESTLAGGVLAARFGVSAGHLARRFKSEMATSLVDYRNRLRMEKFCDLMQGGGERIVSAAVAAGFGSYAQFHRVFCRATGMTPRDYLGSGGAHPVGAAASAVQ